MASLNLSARRFNEETPLPNAFIDHYMTKANHSYSIIYIYGYRHCLSQASAITTEAMSRALNMLESDIVNGWKYWQSAGLVELDGCEDGFSVCFLPVPEPAASEPALSVAENLPEPEQPPDAPQPPTAHQPLVVLASRPQYTLEELEIYKRQSKDIAAIFAKAESMLGKLLTYNDLNLLFGLYDWLRLPVDVILKLIDYCEENDRRNLRYLEKAAIDWHDRGIDTPEAAEEHIKTYNTDYREILRAFGLGGRSPSASETGYMNKWLKEYGTPLAIILEACDRTVMSTGKARFPYADKIIKQWSEAGVRTLDEIKRLDESFYKESAKTSAKAREDKPKAAAPRKNRFANFKQRENNYDELEKMEREYLQQSLKG